MAERGYSYWFVQPGAEQRRCGTQIHEDYTEPTNFRVEGLVAEGDFVITAGKMNLKIQKVCRLIIFIVMSGGYETASCTS